MAMLEFSNWKAPDKGNKGTQVQSVPQRLESVTNLVQPTVTWVGKGGLEGGDHSQKSLWLKRMSTKKKRRGKNKNKNKGKKRKRKNRTTTTKKKWMSTRLIFEDLGLNFTLGHGLTFAPSF